MYNRIGETALPAALASGHAARRGFALRPLAYAVSLLVCSVAMAATAGLAHAQDTSQQVRQEQHSFSIASGALAPALRSFAATSGIAVTFTADQTDGKHTKGLQGVFGLQDGFAALLSGTGLQAVHLDNGGYVLRQTSLRQVQPAVPALPQINVTSDATREAGARTIVSKEDLERSGANNLADVIRYQPLVSAPGGVSGGARGQNSYDRSGTTGYNIRGIEGNRIGLDVDGVELPDAVDRSLTSGSGRAAIGTFGMGRDFIDPDTYSAVDIQSGTTNARRSSGGIGGAVSFRTKSAEDFVNANKPTYVGLKTGYRTLDKSWSNNVTAAGLTDSGLSGLVSYTRRDGKQEKNDSKLFPAYPADWHSDALLLKGGWRLDSEHRLEVSADIFRRDRDSAYESYSFMNSAASAIPDVMSRQNSKTERDTFQLSHVWTPANGLVDQLNTRLYYQTTNMADVTRNTPASTQVQEYNFSQNKTDAWGLSTLADKRLNNHYLRFGFNASTTDIEHPMQVSPLVIGNTQIVPAAQPYPDTRTLRLGAFLEDEISMDVGGKRLAIIPGLRVDRISTDLRNTGSFDNARITQAQLEQLYGGAKNHTIVSPSLGLVYDIKPDLSAYAQWKRSGRAPNINEVYGYWNGGGGSYAVIGNPDLKEEQSDAFDIGLKGSPTKGIAMTSSLFYTKYKDFIAYTAYSRTNHPQMFADIQSNVSQIYQADNRDDAKIYGLEITARIDHGEWSPSVRGLYSVWAVGYSKGSAKSYYAGDRRIDLDSVQPPKAIAGIGYDDLGKQWGANLMGTFVRGKQASVNGRNSFSNAPGVTVTTPTAPLMRIPGYARFDLAGYWNVAPNIRISGGIDNLTDQRHWDYASARNLRAGNARDWREYELLGSAGRTYRIALGIDF